jgi:hypothetical protein
VAYPHHVVLRLVTLPLLGLCCYVLSWEISGVSDLREAPRTLSLWAGTGLLAILAWLEVSAVWVAPAWMVFAVVLAVLARRIRGNDLALQEHVLAVAVAAQLFAVNLNAGSAFVRYLPVLGCAAALYAISRFCTLPQAPNRLPVAWGHTWLATALLAALAWHEASQPWLTAIWAAFALAIALVDRFFGAEELPWQAHLLALLAVLRAVTLNLFDADRWHGIDLRLITVSILVAALYALARWVRFPEHLRETETRHIYTWVATALFAWMLWSELQPIAVAVGLAVFGLVLFEVGDWRALRQIRFQGYVALAAAFGRIFFVNLTAASVPGDWLSPRIYTVTPIVLIFFYVWTRLSSATHAEAARAWSPRDLVAYFGTASIASLLYFQVSAEWVAGSWALLLLVLLAAAYLLKHEVFLQQSALLTAGITARGVAHNIFGGSYFTGSGWRGSIFVLSLTSLLLLAGLPVALALQRRYQETPLNSRLSQWLAADRLEQWLFFSPLLLIGLMIFVEMNPGTITLAWGVEGLAAIVLGLIAVQRSYRIAGLGLLVLCVGKIVALDAWRLGQRDRYITFIALGAALTLVSWLYSRYREVVRRLL